MEREKKATATRSHIESTALRLFAERGYSATSTRRVAEDSGVSEGLIFHHFGTKDGLLESILRSRRELASQVIASVEKHTEERTSLPDCLDAIRGELVSSLDADTRFFVMIAAESSTNERVRQALSGMLGRMSNAMAAYLEARKDAGEVRIDCDVVTAAQTLVRSLIGLNLTTQITADGADLEKMMRTMMDVFQRGVRV